MNANDRSSEKKYLKYSSVYNGNLTVNKTEKMYSVLSEVYYNFSCTELNVVYILEIARFFRGT